MFRPPPGDPYGITADDLKEKLRYVGDRFFALESFLTFHYRCSGCLSATPAFGKMAVPLFIEKLTMGTPATKV